ncbi:MAG: carboxypeptidase M32 [Planctomycetota bacterium]
MSTLPTVPDIRCAAYEELREYLRESAIAGSIGSLVGWDQETYLPRKGAALRAEQRRILSRLLHERGTSDRLGELIAECEGDAEVLADPIAVANVREMRKDYDRAVKLPGDLVESLAECASLGMNAWREARAKSDFSLFFPWLKKGIDLNQRKADCLSGTPGQNRYDTLMDQYEPGMTSERVRELFGDLRESTLVLLDKVLSSKNAINASCVTVETDLNSQRALCEKIMASVGFDFDAGRFDDTTHPFCSGFGPGDTRLTNRYRADGWSDSVACAMHEGGHGLYEQGLLKGDHFGQPIAESISLGIHESQSRLWENQVGRSVEFLTWVRPMIEEYLGSSAAGTSVDELYQAVNELKPSFIRVESDELTYNLHIMLRFDFERAMIEGELDPKDLAPEWNKRIKSDLGLDVSNDAQGCLQDVHWSMTAMGYFPTYTLGNMYAATWWNQIAKDVPNRDELIAKGDFAPVLGWTRTNIHTHGRRYGAEELCKLLTGDGLSAKPLINYLTEKVDRLYG